jgi:uncharacterized protein (DUF486 family)
MRMGWRGHLYFQAPPRVLVILACWGIALIE